MASISSRTPADAVLHVEGMRFAERERLAHEVDARQPKLFASVVVLQRQGATLVQMEVLLNLLLVFCVAMRISGSDWPVVSEDAQDRCSKRVSRRARFIEGLSPQLQAQAVADAVVDYSEQLLLALVFGKFTQGELLTIKTQAEKMLMLAALNRVECIAQTAPRRTV